MGVQDIEKEKFPKIKVANGMLHLENYARQARIFDAKGRIVKRCGKTKSIAIGALPKGIYCIDIIDENNNRFTKKIAL